MLCIIQNIGVQDHVRNPRTLQLFHTLVGTALDVLHYRPSDRDRMSDLSFLSSRLNLSNQIQLSQSHQHDRGKQTPASVTLVPDVEQTDKPDHEDDGIQRGVAGYPDALPLAPVGNAPTACCRWLP